MLRLLRFLPFDWAVRWYYTDELAWCEDLLSQLDAADIEIPTSDRVRVDQLAPSYLRAKREEHERRHWRRFSRAALRLRVNFLRSELGKGKADPASLAEAMRDRVDSDNI